jgi:pyroglutamyl-peptidase
MTTLLVTGFEPYGAWPSNPTGTIAQHLDGWVIGDYKVIGRVLPVTLDGLGQRVADLIEELAPVAVLSLGLFPGAATLRVERVGLNVADFARPDNDGVVVHDKPIVAGQALAHAATLPVHAIRDAHTKAGVPSVVSNSAGTYLCNATLYQFLHECELRALSCQCGFIHVPFEPAQVAATLSGAGDGASGGGPLQDCVPSMHIETMTEGVRIALTTIVEHQHAEKH